MTTFKTLCFTLAIALGCLFSCNLSAQGGPENVLLVVNSQSDSSKLLANHYIELRKIPSTHVVYLDNVKYREFTDEENFRETVLQPAIDEITNRNLGTCIDYIVYSSDIPTAINIIGSQKRLFAQAEQQGQTIPEGSKRIFGSVASCTSLTYFAKQVLADDPTFMTPTANFYMRTRTGPGQYLPTRSFHASDRWTPQGELTDDPRRGRGFYISTILSVTRNWGLNEQDAVAALENSVSADGKPPEGTVFFTENPGPRTSPRKPFFAETIVELNKLGIKTRTIREKVPQNAVVAGLVAGFAEADLVKSGSEYSKGVICDNLTSVGGKFIAKNQLKCTEFLKFGAAGSNGCVAEPFNIPQKFPHPMIQVHYARGSTLGEAYYQSIHCPYQNLIVGDPLCRPFGTPPEFSVSGIQPDQPVSGDIQLQLAYTGEVPVGKIHVYVDGVRIKELFKVETIDLDSRELSDGFHELRVVAIADGPIEFNTRKIIPIVVNNNANSVTISTTSGQSVFESTDNISIEVQANSGSVTLLNSGRVLASSKNKKHTFKISASELGRGPVQLQAVTRLGSGNVFSAPLKLQINGESSRVVPQPDIMRPRKPKNKK